MLFCYPRALLAQVINQFEFITSVNDGSMTYPPLAVEFARGLGLFNFDMIAYFPPACVDPDSTFYDEVKQIGRCAHASTG